MSLQSEIAKRRTFGIISHPDAGKTTLTEKLLLFGGAIQKAGAVKSNKADKSATSDFMEIEKQRGISVATSVMGFEYLDTKINILDTPGHKDFAEDTYRTLSAVDSVILVVDCVKGVEEQTEKLMSVCRMRNTPVIIFINKMDREGKEAFDLGLRKVKVFVKGPGAGREHVCQHGSAETAQAGQPHGPCAGVHSHQPLSQRAAVRPVHHRTAAAGHQRYGARSQCRIGWASPHLPIGLRFHQSWRHAAGLAQCKAAAGRARSGTAGSARLRT